MFPNGTRDNVLDIPTTECSNNEDLLSIPSLDSAGDDEIMLNNEPSEDDDLLSLPSLVSGGNQSLFYNESDQFLQAEAGCPSPRSIVDFPLLPDVEESPSVSWEYYLVPIISFSDTTTVDNGEVEFPILLDDVLSNSTLLDLSNQVEIVTNPLQEYLGMVHLHFDETNFSYNFGNMA